LLKLLDLEMLLLKRLRVFDKISLWDLLAI
jgi:hypothetical protein